MIVATVFASSSASRVQLLQRLMELLNVNVTVYERRDFPLKAATKCSVICLAHVKDVTTSDEF